jgi:hypothetical protein
MNIAFILLRNKDIDDGIIGRPPGRLVKSQVNTVGGKGDFVFEFVKIRNRQTRSVADNKASSALMPVL